MIHAHTAIIAALACYFIGLAAGVVLTLWLRHKPRPPREWEQPRIQPTRPRCMAWEQKED